MERIEFKYHPNLYSDEILIRGEGVCNCCGKKVTEYIDSVYSPEDLDCICLGCISDGSAAEKFDAEFVQYAEEVSARRVICPGREKTGLHVAMTNVPIWGR